jgi:glutamate racemase
VLFPNQNPIGIFDSGVGGLTVFAEVRKILPNESVFYLGDTARVPYGSKSVDVIRRYSLANVNMLATLGVKAVVVACNTASAAALSFLQNCFSNLEIIGVIDPVVEYLCTRPELKKIGVIGTNTTIASKAYQNALLGKRGDLDVVARSCPLFVPLVEEGLFDGEITEKIIDMYLGAMKKSSLDALILGCTHYPMLRQAVFDYFGGKVEILDTAFHTARKLAAVLSENSAENSGPKESDRFFVTDSPDSFRVTAELFLGQGIENVFHV